MSHTLTDSKGLFAIIGATVVLSGCAHPQSATVALATLEAGATLPAFVEVLKQDSTTVMLRHAVVARDTLTGLAGWNSEERIAIPVDEILAISGIEGALPSESSMPKGFGDTREKFVLILVGAFAVALAVFLITFDFSQ